LSAKPVENYLIFCVLQLIFKTANKDNSKMKDEGLVL